jgi:hypothetical protein
MKLQLKIWTLLLGVVALTAACSDETEALTSSEVDGESFTLTVGVELPDATTRALGETEDFDPSTASLKLLAFNEQHLLTNVYEGAYVESKEGHNYYTVTLKSSEEKRYIHLLVNHNDLDTEADLFGTEATVFTDSHMIVGEGIAVYWQRVELEKVTEETAREALNHLQLVRNFSKVNLKYTANTSDTYYLKDPEWGAMMLPAYGSVAPYVTDQTFAQYIDDEGTLTTYANLTGTQGYTGYVPRTAANQDNFYLLSTADDANKIEWKSVDTPIYMFENEGSSGSQSWQTTSFFIRGYLVKNGKVGAMTYYRFTLVDATKNYQPLNILRNVSYTFTIDKIGADGFDTAVEAFTRASGNNISGATETSSYPGITASGAALQVEYIKKYILSPEPFSMGFRYVPDVTKTSGGVYVVKNNYVALKKINDANQLESLPTTITDDSYAIKGYSIATSESTDDNNYRQVTFTPNTPRTAGRSITSTIRFAVTDSEHSNLYRDVTFILRERYKIQDMEVTEDGDGENCFVLSVDVPADLAKELFPLDFTFEASPAVVYPNVQKSQMEVNTIYSSIFESTEGASFNYHQMVRYKTYQNTLTEHGSGGFVEDNGYKKITFFFKVNKTAFAGGATTAQVRLGVYCNSFSPDPDADISATKAQIISETFTFRMEDGTIRLAE